MTIFYISSPSHCFSLIYEVLIPKGNSFYWRSVSLQLKWSFLMISCLIRDLVYKDFYSYSILSSTEWVTLKSEKQFRCYCLHSHLRFMYLPWLVLSFQVHCCLDTAEAPSTKSWFFFHLWSQYVYTLHTDTYNLRFASHESLLSVSCKYISSLLLFSSLLIHIQMSDFQVSSHTWWVDNGGGNTGFPYESWNMKFCFGLVWFSCSIKLPSTHIENFIAFSWALHGSE